GGEDDGVEDGDDQGDDGQDGVRGVRVRVHGGRGRVAGGRGYVCHGSVPGPAGDGTLSSGTVPGRTRFAARPGNDAARRSRRAGRGGRGGRANPRPRRSAGWTGRGTGGRT